MFRFLTVSVCLLAHLFRLDAQPIPGQVIVEWADKTAASSILQYRNLSLEKTLAPAFHIDLLRIQPPPDDPDAWMEAFRQTPGVVVAQWDYYLEFNATPNDPRFPEQWSPDHIGADLVWDQTTGGTTATGDTIVVAVLDGGFDLDHEDLAENIWVNRGEIPGNGVDDDENGLTDDSWGWNFADDSPEHPVDHHGTAVLGIIGAVGNNLRGVAGLNWHIKMMLLTTETVSDVIEAYTYVIDQRELYASSQAEKGALVVATNASFGLSDVFCEEQPIWGAMYDRLGEAGILTAAATSNNPVNVDLVGDMPASCPSPFLITVLNTDPWDEKESGSGYGPVSVDMGAPGVSIITTNPNDKYGFFNGTSAATPHVCGAIALLYSLPCMDFASSIQTAPQQTALAVKDALMQGVTPSPGLGAYTLSGGRLAVDRSFQILESLCGTDKPKVLSILNAFPNPANEGIQVEYQAHSQKRISYRLINALGQLIMEEALPVSDWPSKRFYLSFPNLPKGNYLLVLTDGQVQVSKLFFLY